MVVHDAETLKLLLQKRDLKNITFLFSNLSAKENETWQNKIIKTYYACGCKSGMFFLITTTSIVLAYFIRQAVLSHSIKITYFSVYTALIIILAAALIGKMIGVKIAKYKLNRNIKQLLNALPA